MTDLNVIVVVVTYNRKQLLLHTLSGLKAQTHSPNKIIIIDNASTDGTPELLRTSGVLEDPLIDYVRSAENTGGAGGFHMGMKRALEAGADWIWIMDDDVAPDPDCLAVLLKYRDVSECIHPRKFFPDGSESPSERYYDILTSSSYAPANLSFRNGKDIIFNNTAIFEGMLVSRRIVENVGLPDEKYFICGDDTLFAVKASIHTNISHVRDAIIRKLIMGGGFAPWRHYYMIRNRFYLFRDSCEYLEIQPHTSERIKFIALQAMEVIRVSFKGFRHFTAGISGFADGMRYMRGFGQRPLN